MGVGLTIAALLCVIKKPDDPILDSSSLRATDTTIRKACTVLVLLSHSCILCCPIVVEKVGSHIAGTLPSFAKYHSPPQILSPETARHFVFFALGNRK